MTSQLVTHSLYKSLRIIEIKLATSSSNYKAGFRLLFIERSGASATNIVS